MASSTLLNELLYYYYFIITYWLVEFYVIFGPTLIVVEIIVYKSSPKLHGRYRKLRLRVSVTGYQK